MKRPSQRHLPQLRFTDDSAMSRWSAADPHARPAGDLRSWTVRCTLAGAAILALAGTLAWAPAASASPAGASPQGRSADTARALVRNVVRQRAVSLPPTVSVGNGPDALALDAATHTLYTSNQNDNTVSVISTATCSARQARGCDQRVRSIKLPAGASPQGIAFDAATGTLYVTDIGDNTISVINTRTCNAVRLLGLREGPCHHHGPGRPDCSCRESGHRHRLCGQHRRQFLWQEPHRRRHQRRHLQRPSACGLRAAPRPYGWAPVPTASPSTRPPTPSTWSTTAPPTTATPSR